MHTTFFFSFAYSHRWVQSLVEREVVTLRAGEPKLTLLGRITAVFQQHLAHGGDSYLVTIYQSDQQVKNWRQLGDPKQTSKRVGKC